LLNAVCPGLPGKPLDATIGQLLTPYHPSGCQGNSKQNNDKKWTNFAAHFDSRGGAPVQYRVHCPMEEIQGFDRSHWTLPLGKNCSQWMQLVMHMPVLFSFFIVNL
jgi:hypothetical protein